MQGRADTHPGANPYSGSYAKQRVGNGWDPGPLIEVTDIIQSSQSHSKGTRGEAGGRRNPAVGKEWTLNKLGGGKVLRIDSHWEPVRHRSLTQTGRSKQSDLWLHWIRLTPVDGGPVRGRNKGKWAVSTDGCWTPHPVGGDMAHSIGV